ncbi:MAG TPA: bifunctional alpha,alpha-trehalose-phosphate synthase (UDP-forming)/trehalose-phosphatase [Chitinophagales bacterium]|nr:bifunctional alpha,alpha-trehalose-phosphate synthase (UDP-forming)/trehalose-phosphatase [Chitinophagales bacterium]
MRLVIVSNRAPVNLKKGNGGFVYEESSGGLASGLRAYRERMCKRRSAMEIIWLGWPGTSVEKKDEEKIKQEVAKKFGTHCVFLSEETMEKFYEGFCNKTLWPLFHYFPSLAVYDNSFWEQYISVNKLFCDAVMEIAKPGDIFWVHDYHLMLLPVLLREKIPEATIGFFLHIPFPSYEVFRLLPSDWRKNILAGLYGADLIGFHTHDYRTYFLRSTLRVLGLPDQLGEVVFNDRVVKVDTFPMGIDYDKYHSAAFSKTVVDEKEKLSLPFKIILSIDRQDYSKGILNRLRGFEHFLETNPQWKQKVVLMMVVVPSRIGVESYQTTKSKIDELVGSINGKHGTFGWQPIHYQYRSLSFTELIALYNRSDAALVTPLRDGMNLIAKEYIACRTDGTGVLILSEMAGAVDELFESIVINPNNVEEISHALRQALEMSGQEQQERLAIMQKRLIDYDVFKWADDFLSSIQNIKSKQQRLSAKILNAEARRKIFFSFKRAHSALLFLDYDGTLVPFADYPPHAFPRQPLLELLCSLAKRHHTEVVILSGRDRKTLDQWFGSLPLHLAAEHGLFLKEKEKTWRQIKPVRKNWKKKLLPVLEHYAGRLPGALVEEKELSLVFHYRKSNPAFADLRVKELVNHLVNLTGNLDVQVLRGNHLVELRNAGIDKGVAALHWLSKEHRSPRFILSIGDDWTDEDLFRVMPPGAFSIKVGLQPSYALYNLKDTSSVLSLLEEMSKK